MKRKNWLKNKFLHVIYAIGCEYSGFRNTYKKKTEQKNILLILLQQDYGRAPGKFYGAAGRYSSYTLYLCFGDKLSCQEKAG